ncbi:MAG: DUF1559 domain-containing protein [Janthinobacterium lividum]
MNSVIWFTLILALLFLFAPLISFILHGGELEGVRIASCQSNMKQIGLALDQYSQDNNGTLPRYSNANGHGWREAIYPYIKSTGVYRCPDDKRDSSHDSADNIPKSYAANHIASAMPIKLKMFADPALTISAVDTRGYGGEEWNMTDPAFLPTTGRELYSHTPRHLFYERMAGKVNFLFADGHVKALKPAATLVPINLWTVNNAPFTGQDLQNAQAILTHAENEQH